VFQSEKNVMAVIHFVAYKAVGESVKEPLNLDGMKVVGYTSAIQVFFLVLSGFIG
jgi:UDP-glucose 4-epimerase